MNEELKNKIECCDLTDVGIENLLRYINYDVKLLIQPQDLNLQWDKCAIIITKMGYQVVKPFLIDLFEWLQDMNWPGALTIRSFLLTIPKDEFDQLYCTAFNIALERGDDDWAYNLKLLLKLRNSQS